MNESMSMWSLISQASLVVQFVMILLVLAAFFAWVVIFSRVKVVGSASRNSIAFEDAFWGSDLTQLYTQVSKQADLAGMELLFVDGFKEFARLRKNQLEADAIMDGVHRAMRIAMSREQEKLENGLSFLASVGSTSPYVGLFGTVWGIMDSFRSLANVSQATLQVVAPGIAEALIATAIGLFAAIPAVIAYNRFSTSTERLLARYETFAEEFYAILHRQAHAQTGDQA